MNARAACTLIFLVGCGAWTARGETWTSLAGQTWEGRLGGVYGTTAVFATKKGSIQASLETLDDTGLHRVADHLAAQSAAPAWKDSASPMAKALRSRLQVLQGGKLATFEVGARPEPDIYLVYFGALWCGPCVRFSPTLVQAYQNLKRVAGDRFELVFVSSDNSGREQLDYVKKVQMPWPLLKFSSVGGVGLIERWKGRGIPCLVALTRDGDVIFHSYRGEEYLGPSHVLREFSALASLMGGEPSNATKRALHRLAVVQHVRAAGGGSAGPRPYVISFDRRRNQTLEVKNLVARIELDPQGRVTGVTFEPKLDTVVEYQLVQEAEKWLFLPAVEQGRAVARRVEMPIKL